MRVCGSCNLCCKVVAVVSLKKPAGQWCQHAVLGRGCRIYGAHPDDCKVFKCGWLETPEIGDEWKPDKCKMVVRAELDGLRLCVDVDPTSPTVWRREPYYSQIKTWSRGIWQEAGHVVVYVGEKAIAIFPEEDLEVGPVLTGEEMYVGYQANAQQRRPVARVSKSDGTRVEVRGAWVSSDGSGLSFGAGRMTP